MKQEDRRPPAEPLSGPTRNTLVRERLRPWDLVGQRTFLMRYGFAVVITLVCFYLRIAVLKVNPVAPFDLLLLAVVVSAWYGGLGPGLVATLEAALLIDVVQLPPAGALSLDPASLGEIGFFALNGIVIGSLTARTRRAEASAFQRGEHFRVTLASIGDGVIVTDMYGKVTFMNEVAAGLTGWSVEQAIGSPIELVFAVVNEQSGQSVENPVSRVLREGRVVGLANHSLLICRDGSRRPIDDSGAPLRDARGQLIGSVLVFRDVTARRQAEQRLAASEDRYRALVENASDIVYSLDLNGQLTSLNNAGEQIIGVRREEVLGQSIGPFVRPADVDVMRRMLAAKLAGDAQTNYDLELTARDGRRIVLEVSSRLIEHGGQPIGIQGIARDITERKRQDEVLQLLADAGDVLSASLDEAAALEAFAQLVVPRFTAGCVLYLVDPAGTPRRRLVASAAGVTLESGVAGSEEALSDPLTAAVELSETSDLPIVPRALKASFAKWNHSSPRVKADSGQTLVVPLIARGHTLGAVAYVAVGPERHFDPLERTLAEELARRAALALDNARLYASVSTARAEAVAALGVRNEFLSVAAHELKTPLTSLRGVAQLELRRIAQRRSFDPEQLGQTLRVIDHQSQRLAQLVNHLLDVSRLEAGRLSLERIDSDLTAIVAEAVAEAQHRAARHQINFDAPSHLTVWLDPVRIEQVLTNLLDNAIKYSPGGSPIEVTLAAPTEAEVVLSVRDHGIGIPEDDRPRVFERFYQAHTKEYLSGLGLGLFISREIVELHGGSLTAEFPDAVGSCFVVHLPRYQPPILD